MFTGLTLRDKEKNDIFATECHFMSENISETLREITPGLGDDGQYVLLSVIREGRLYLAAKAGKRFVLKTSDGSARGLEQLKREYELSIGLSHPGLAYVFTYEASSPAGPCIVQEYVDGETLTDWLGHNPSVRERRRIFSELLSVTAYLHQKGIIHNDLKPGNILISRSSSSLKLIDLGFADDDTFAQKALGGTRSYASPELLAGGRVDARSDIYSLGTLLGELFPGRYGRIVRRCHQEDPGKRYASAEALRKAWATCYRPVRIVLYVAVAGLIAGLLAFQQRSFREMDAAAQEQHRADRQLVDSLSSVLDSLHAAQREREALLARAKADVDRWYEREVPAYQAALRKARTQEEATAAWAALARQFTQLNTDIPDSVPDPLRASVRDYLLDRYNGAFPSLYNALTEKMQALAR